MPKIDERDLRICDWPVILRVERNFPPHFLTKNAP